MVGKTLGHYEILEPLGAGGMGEVYRARDTKLDRDVAIKVLPEDFSTDPDRLARFEREAKLLASLNHANIAAIYGLEDEGDQRFIVMEVVEGQTLAERIASSGRIEVDEALEIARQIAEALEAAHENGVIHRDLKPANVIVTTDGKAKVLDFGLAKAYEPDGSPAEISPDLSASPTMAAATRTGVIMGTAAYMSPEQAAGKGVDRRSDNWSFGVLLFEMLTGRRLFSGENVSETLAAVLRDEADWDALPRRTPAALRRLLRRCLERDRKHRLQHIGDARIEVNELIAGTSVEEAAGAVRRPHLTGPVLALIVVALVGAFMAGGLLHGWLAPAPNTAAPAAFSISLPSGAPLALGRGTPIGFDMRLLDISRDGTRVVYVADRGSTTQLYLASVGDFGAVPLAGTEGAASPFFSPDGEWVGYVSDAELRKVPLAGGRPETVFQGSGAIWGGAWDEDGIYLVDGTGTTLWRVPADGGGAPVEIGRVESAGYENFWPVATLPEGRGVVVTASRWLPMSGDYRDILVWSAETQEWRIVLEAAGYDARYSPSGHLVYARAGGLWAVGFDLENLEVTGEPQPLLNDVRVDAVFNYAQFAFSDAGTLVYARGGDAGVGVPTWVDRQGNVDPIDMAPQVYGVFRLSPDGRQLAIHVAGPTDHVWIHDVATGRGRRLTAEGSNGWPIWSPDGERVVFNSTRSGRWGLYVRSTDGSGEAIELLPSDRWLIPQSWSPRDETIAFNESLPLRAALLSVEEGRDPVRLSYPQTAVEWGHGFSPDGQWIAYASDRDGVFEVWVRPFPELEPEHKVSAGGGQEPIWGPQGDELFYRKGNQWMRATVATEPNFSVGGAQELFRTNFVDTFGVSWDLGRDGRVLTIKPSADDSDPTELRIVLNWFEELKERVPTGR